MENVGQCGNEGIHFPCLSSHQIFLLPSCPELHNLVPYTFQDDISTLSQILITVESVNHGQRPLKYKPN